MKINHVGIVVENLEKSIQYYREQLGLEVEPEIYRDIVRKVKIAFVNFPNHNLKFELLEPLTEDSPIMNALKKGGGPNHICYEVEDIDGAIKSFCEKGGRLISRPMLAPAFEGRKAAFIYTQGNEIIELVESKEIKGTF